ncbi:Formate hydrogenlyase subunit 7-like protein [hydrothermal vent metagenome]|uniref:Formate hydrogenlyase subunit 7-like protein n=1 Tax=hydrothermal vent metagenome TaxID=652676 RepID=A0A3B0Z3C0_9ZZZZ
MLRILNKIRKTGIVTEPLTEDRSLEALGIELKRLVDRRMRGSFAIREVDAGSCNACELEVHALNNPYYDIERFGVHFVASPRHADALLVTGPVSRHMAAALKRTYDAVPAPKWVIAMGDCTIDGGEFGCNYATVGAVERIVPVDLVIPGCPPTPAVLMRALLALLQQ